MKHFVLYDSANGQILQTGTVQDIDFYRVAGRGQGCIEGTANIQRHKVVDGAVWEREGMPALIDKIAVAEGEMTTITGIPTGTTANVDGDYVVVNDGTLQLTFNIAGKYEVTLSLFPYLDWTRTITCS